MIRDFSRRKVILLFVLGALLAADSAMTPDAEKTLLDNTPSVSCALIKTGT